MAIISGKTSEVVRPALDIARREILRAENGSGTFLWFAFENLNTLIREAENDKSGHWINVNKDDYKEALKLRDQIVAFAEKLGASLNKFGRN